MNATTHPLADLPPDPDCEPLRSRVARLDANGDRRLAGQDSVLPVKVGAAPGGDDAPARQGEALVCAAGQHQAQEGEQRRDQRILGQRRPIRRVDGQAEGGGGALDEGAVGVHLAGQQCELVQRQAGAEMLFFEPAQRFTHLAGAVGGRQKLYGIARGKLFCLRTEEGALQMAKDWLFAGRGRRERRGLHAQRALQPFARPGEAPVRQPPVRTQLAGECNRQVAHAARQRDQEVALGHGEAVEAVHVEVRPASAQ